MSTTEPRHIVIFDTTLRDGEQSPRLQHEPRGEARCGPGAGGFGVDVIEAGFPIASPGDFEAVREVARNVRGSTICGLARCNEKDIDRAWEALCDAPDARIPRVPRHQRNPSSVQAPHGQGRDHRAGGGRGETCQRVLRKHRVLARGCPPAPRPTSCAAWWRAAIDAGATR